MMARITNRLLGYPEDARLLIINADDFGLCHAITDAIFRALTVGVVTSTTLMTPCPWAYWAMALLRSTPTLAFGVHLTAICDMPNQPWRPLSPKAAVPSLVDEAGYLHRAAQMVPFLAQAERAELEIEFRAQIEAVFAAGLHPSHLDWHYLRLGQRPDIIDLMVGLAKEYGLALRVIGQSMIEQLQAQGLPTADYDFLDSFSVPLGDSPAPFLQRLRDLPVGLSEWALHPAYATAEYRTLQPDGVAVRQRDVDFLLSPLAQEVIDAEGIILLDYRALQAVWKGEECLKNER